MRRVVERWMRPDPGPSAEAHRQLLRSLDWSVAACVGLLPVALAPQIAAQSELSSWWWSIAVIALFEGCGIAFAVAAASGSFRTRSIATVALYAVAVVGAIGWRLGWDGRTLPVRLSDPWLLLPLGMAVVALASISSMSVTIATQVAAIAVVYGAFDAARPNPGLANSLADAAGALVVSGLILLAIRVALEMANHIDRARLEADSTVEHLGRQRSRSAALRHLGALVHDHVLFALLAATRSPGDDSVPELASLALAKLDEARSSDRAPGADAMVSAARAGRELLAVVSELDSSCIFATTCLIEGPSNEIPRSALDQLSEAMAEAVRNSLLHAGGDGIEHAVTIRVSAEGLRIVVSDDGPGFDLGSVDPARLGVRQSILSRIGSTAGASVQIDAAPGRGTRIEVLWCRPASPRAVFQDGRPSKLSQQVRPLKALPEYATALAVAVVACYGYIGLLDQFDRGFRVQSLIDFLVLVAACAIVRWWPGRTLPALPTGLIVCAGFVTTAGASQDWPYPYPDRHWQWMLTAWTVVGVALVVRGRIVSAWLLAGVVSLIPVWWITGHGQSIAAGIEINSMCLSMITAATVFALAYRRYCDKLEQLLRVSDDAAVEAARAEQRQSTYNRILDTIDRQATPALSRIAAGAALSESDLAEVTRLEWRLRDLIRAPALTGAALDREFDRLRRGGVRVRLIDDGGLAEVDEAILAALHARLLEITGEISEGELRIRVDPLSDGQRVTVVTLDGQGGNTWILTPPFETATARC